MATIAPKTPVTLQGFTFATPVELVNALGVIVQTGFTGTIICYRDDAAPGGLVWRMTVHAEGKEDVFVYLDVQGHDPAEQTWLIYDGVNVTTMTDAAFAATYTVTAP